MKSRSLTTSVKNVVNRESLAAVLGALTDVCGERVEGLLGGRSPSPEQARPWSRVACKLEELAIFCAEHRM